MKKKICNKDCFNCPFQDCVNDEMDHEVYIVSAKRKRELKATPKSKKAAACWKAYYEANREKVAAAQKAYREANREKLGEKQTGVREIRKELNLSQREAAEILGVSQALISFWESGRLPCDAEAIAAALREGKTV